MGSLIVLVNKSWLKCACFRFSCYYRFSDIAINSVNPYNFMVLVIYQIILHLNKITECLKMTTFKIVFNLDVFFSAEKNPEGLYKIELCRLPLRHRFFLSCNCHGVTDRTCKQKSWLKCENTYRDDTLKCLVRNRK
jgi:hypothetical protein